MKVNVNVGPLSVSRHRNVYTDHLSHVGKYYRQSKLDNNYM